MASTVFQTASLELILEMEILREALQEDLSTDAELL